MLILIHYITNYVTKSNCSQYQRVIAIAIMKKTFKNYDKNPIFTFANYIPILDKFLLKAFNQYTHNREINKPLVACFLLDLLDRYFSKVVFKIINITLWKTKFPLILSRQNFNQSNNIVYVNNAKVSLYLIYKYYVHFSLEFEKVSIYKYF